MVNENEMSLDADMIIVNDIPNKYNTVHYSSSFNSSTPVNHRIILLNIFTNLGSNGFNIIHINIQSMPAHIDELRSDLSAKTLDAIYLSETWLNLTHSAPMVKVEGYSIFRNDRSSMRTGVRETKRGGGVAILVKKCYRSKIIAKSSSIVEHSCEYIFVEISSNSEKLLAGCVYRPNHCNNLDDFFDLLESLALKYNKIAIGGDFNLNLLEPIGRTAEYVENIERFNLYFVNKTHITHHLSIIDHFIVAEIDKVLLYQQFDAPAYSKHDVIFVSIKFGTKSDDIDQFSYRNYSAINYDQLNHCLDLIDFNSLLMSSIDVCAADFNAILLSLFTEHVPLVTKASIYKINPWMNNNIMKLRQSRDAAFKFWKQRRQLFCAPVLFKRYVSIRNQVTATIRRCKKDYFAKKLNPCLPSKILWNNLRSVGVSAHNNDDPCDLSPNSLINNFFPANTVNEVNVEISRRICPGFSFTPVGISDVVLAVASIKSSATGLDEISPKFVKIILPYIINFLTDLINRCLQEGIFPSCWKKAKVVAVPKKSEGFRPISILSFLSKILEKIMASQINTFTSNFNLINETQSGFRKLHSCKSAILHVTHEISQMLDQNQVAILILIDFSKAFDTINHKTMLLKLKHRFGFSVLALKLMENYLADRKSLIFSSNQWSDEVVIKTGVPQGSILGPLLYCLYVEDMASCFNNLNMHCYADDTQLFTSSSSNDLCHTINTINYELEHLSAWATNNNLNINASKSQCILISRKPIPTLNLPVVQLGSDVIDYVAKVNNLGYIINNNLSWNDHITKCCQSLYFGLRCLWNLGHILPEDTKVKIAQSLFGHHFYNLDVVCGKLNYANLTKLQKGFNAITRFVYNLRRFDHISGFNTKVFGFNLPNFLIFRRMIFMFNLIDKREPGYLFNKIKFAQSSRHVKNIIIPRFNYVATSSNFFINDAIYWNSLPNWIKNCTKIDDFKTKLTYFLSD